jgi:beta-galactosidase
MYTNVQMPFDTLYPHVPHINPSGVYRLVFDALPHSWVESDDDGDIGCGGAQIRRRVVLHLGGVDSCFFVYVNGRFVGMGKDSRLPSEFDVTSHVRHLPAEGGEGGLSSTTTGGDGGGDTEEMTNTLAVVVLKWSDSSFLEQQDHWRGMAGIHRSVFLYSTPAAAYIEDVFCRAEIVDLDDDMPPTVDRLSPVRSIELGRTYVSFLPLYRGRLKVQARIGRDDRTRVGGRNIYYNEQIGCARTDDDDGGDEDATYRMVFQLYGSSEECDSSEWKALFDEPIDPTREGDESIMDAHFRSNLVSFHVDVPGYVLAWSDENPKLYRFRATLIRTGPTGTTSVIDVYNCSVGFRNVEVADRKLLVNGQPVLIKGVNRHDHSSTRGKANSLDEILEDLKLMKEFNFNAIRTAHYPNDPYLYEMADELGLYVIDEANIECHGHYDMICREHSFTSAMLDRVQRMVVRDQNHPCIIGWSLGNEAGYSMNQTMLFGWVKGYDPSRFVQYEGANRPAWGQLPHAYDRRDSSRGTDIVCPMYPTIKEMAEWADVTAESIGESRPFIMCGAYRL